MNWKRASAYVIAVGLLAVTAFFGAEGIDDFADATTRGQLICTIAVTLYGIAAALALIGLFLQKRWAVHATLVWTAAMVVAGMLAPRVWGGARLAWWATLLTGIVIAAIGAGVARLVAHLVSNPTPRARIR